MYVLSFFVHKYQPVDTVPDFSLMIKKMNENANTNNN
jgi:hypothetical protein